MDREQAEAIGKKALDAIKGYVARSVAPLATRLATVETRTGAITLLLAGRGVDAGKVAELETLLQRVKQLDQLEARIKVLEARPTLRYAGVWREGLGYEPGTFCTHGGSVWHCNATTTAKPGASDDWTLAVKHGKDAR